MDWVSYWDSGFQLSCEYGKVDGRPRDLHWCSHPHNHVQFSL